MSRFLPAALLLFASLPAEAQQPRFSGKIEVKLVTIDVVVTNRGGERIHGLTADDFEVFEGSTRQQVTNFTEYRSVPSRSPGGLPASEPSLKATNTPSTAVVPAPLAGESVSTEARIPTDREPGTLLVLVDYLPRSGFVRSKVFESLRSLVTKVMIDGDRVGIVFWTPGRERVETFIEPSFDLQAVEAAIDRLDRKVTTGSSESTDASQADLENSSFDEASSIAAGKGGIDYAGEKSSTEYFSAEVQLIRLRRKTYAMQRLVLTLAARPGRKSILYVSTSFSLPNDRTVRLSGIRAIDDLAKAANAGGVTFYAVRPAMPDPSDSIMSRTMKDVARDTQAGVSNSTQGGFDSGLEALGRLTLPTGGLLDFGLRSVETVGTDLAEDLQSYYSIGYQARSDGADRQRKIVVRPKNRAYRVRAREAIVEKSNEAMAREVLLTRLFSEEGGNDLHFEVQQGAPRRSGRDRWLLPIVVKIPVDQIKYAHEGSGRVAYVKVLFASAHEFGDVTNVTDTTLKVIGGQDDIGGFVTYSVELLGDHSGSKVSIGILDLRSGLAGARTVDNRNRFR
jgi:VWFA-related protein